MVSKLSGVSAAAVMCAALGLRANAQASVLGFWNGELANQSIVSFVNKATNKSATFAPALYDEARSKGCVISMNNDGGESSLTSDLEHAERVFTPV